MKRCPKKPNINRMKPVAGKNAERCDKCGELEDNPVANMFRGKIEWICFTCYKKKGGRL